MTGSTTLIAAFVGMASVTRPSFMSYAFESIRNGKPNGWQPTINSRRIKMTETKKQEHADVWAALIAASKEFTTMAWFKANAWIGGWQTVFSMQAGGTNGETYGIYFGNAGGTEILVWTTGTSVTTGPGAVDLGVWTHGAVTYDGSKFVIYKNGELAVEKDFGGPVDNKGGGGRFVINGNYNSQDGGLSEWCSATIDEVIIFDTALSLDEIKPYMENGFEAVSPVEPSGKLASTWAQVKTSE